MNGAKNTAASSAAVLDTSLTRFAGPAVRKEEPEHV